MKLTVVRHTRVAIPQGICYGITDVALANTADVDIATVVKQLEHERFDAVFCSPLSRCRILAARISPLPAIIDARLSELDFGDWEMKPWSKIYESEEGKKWFADYLRLRCPNGRSYRDMQLDADAFLSELQRSKNGNVLIVTHAGIIRILISLLEHKTPEESFEVPLAYGEIRHFER